MIAHQTPVGNTPVAHKKTNHYLRMMVSAAAEPELWKISECFGEEILPFMFSPFIGYLIPVQVIVGIYVVEQNMIDT